MARDVIIVDENFSGGAREIMDYGEHIAQIAENYVDIMEFIVETAINDDKICASLNEMIGQVRQIPAAVRSSAWTVHDLLENFVQDIDDADQFLC